MKTSLLCIAALLGLGQADFWVSTTGSDSNPGTQASPFLTLGAAQKAVRNVNSNLNRDLYVTVESGKYYLTEPLTLDASDSGSNGHRVIWQAPDGADISGGIPVTNWEVYNSSSNIWKANVPPGIAGFHLYVNQQHAFRCYTFLDRGDLTLQENGFEISNTDKQYLLDLPGIELGELRSIGSWTDRYIPIRSVQGNTLVMANPAFNNNLVGYDTFTNPSYFTGQLRLQNVLGLLDEVNEYYFDGNDGIIYYKPDDGANMNDQYTVLPILERLLVIGGTYDNPVHDLTFEGFNYMHTTWNQFWSNQGYADQQTGGFIGVNTIYGGVDSNFEESRPAWHQVPGSIQVSAANNISFRNGSVIAIMGGIGIGNDANAHQTGVGLGASNVDVTGMYFTQTGANAITVGGVQADAHHPSDPRMINEYITITENILTNLPYTITGGVPILSTYTKGTQITHNDINNVGYSGICWGYGWGSNDAGGNSLYEVRGLYNYQPRYDTPTTLQDGVIAYNLIQDYGTTHNDLGALYTLSASPNTFSYQNCMANSGYGAIYHDEGSRDYVDYDSTYVIGPWLSRNEYGSNSTSNPGPNTGNLTIHDIYTQGDPQNGQNSYGDNLYNNVQFSDPNSLPEQYKEYCGNAGVSPDQRSGRPVTQPPVS